MKLMRWQDYYNVGVEIVDEQHRVIFNLVNELIVAEAGKQGKQAILNIFETIVDYIILHLRIEEELFTKNSVCKLHRANHVAFQRQLATVVYKHPIEQTGSVKHIMIMLTKWLNEHINDTEITAFDQINLSCPNYLENINEYPKHMTQSMKILVVEDDILQRALLRKCIEYEGYSVIEAASGQEAIKILEKTSNIHYVITDLNMPNGNGFDLIREIRARQIPSIYIMVVTSMSEKETLIESFKLGANDFLIKPIFPPELALRIRNGMQSLQLESQDELIFALAKMVDCRSLETGRHLERVQNYVKIIGNAIISIKPDLRLDEAVVSEIARYSPLHDIGKIAIPDRILNKPGPLTKLEFNIMKQHAIIGGRLIGNILRRTSSRSLSLAYDLTMYHHERWNGAGYPSGLAGEQIPIAARIVALADVYDALTSARIYKQACTRFEAKKIVIQESGKYFDPMVVLAFEMTENRIHQRQEDIKD